MGRETRETRQCECREREAQTSAVSRHDVLSDVTESNEDQPDIVHCYVCDFVSSRRHDVNKKEALCRAFR